MGEELKDYKIIKDLVSHFSSYRDHWNIKKNIVQNFFVSIWILTIFIFSVLEYFLPDHSLTWLIALFTIGLAYLKYLHKISLKLANIYLFIFNKEILEHNIVYEKYGDLVLNNIKIIINKGSNSNFSELVIIKTLEDVKTSATIN